jgi:hypothetical protein
MRLITGEQTLPGDATIVQIAEQMEKQTKWGQGLRCQFENTRYAEQMKAVTLKPKLQSALVVHRLADHTTTGNWSVESTSAEYAGVTAKVSFLRHVDAVPNTASAVTSRYLLMENPTIFWTLERKQPPAGQTYLDQGFAFTFGGHAVLSFGKKPPALQEYDILDVILTYTGFDGKPRTAVRRIRDGEYNFFTDETLVWQIYCVGGDDKNGYELQILCSAWGNEPWVVRGAKTMPMAPWSCQCNTGSYAVNVANIRFETSGTMATGWYKAQGDYRGQELLASVWGTGYALDTSDQKTYWFDKACRAWVTINWADNGTDQYQLILHLEGDGARTPLVQAFQEYRLPQSTPFTPGETDVIEVTSWIRPSSPPDIRIPGDNAPASATLVFQNHQNAFIEFLRDAGADRLTRGQVGVLIATGYTKETIQEDGTPITADTTIAEFVGIGAMRSDPDPLTGVREYSITAYDPLVLLSGTDLEYYPANTGMLGPDALSLMLQWVRVPADKIIRDFTSTDRDDRLDDPKRDYSVLPYFPLRGVNAMDFFRQVADLGYCVYCLPVPVSGQEWPDYEIHIARYGHGDARKVTFVDKPSAPGEISFRDIKATVDYSGTINKLTVIGHDENGLIIEASQSSQQDTPGHWEYTGEQRAKTVSDDNLMTLKAVQKKLACLWARNYKRPSMLVTITTHDPYGALLFPEDRVGILQRGNMASGYVDAVLDYCVKQVSAKHGETQNEYTVELCVIHHID